MGFMRDRFRVINIGFDFEKKVKIYDVDSFTALKTWIFQDHQNI